MTNDDLLDYIARLNRAAESLTTLALDATDSRERLRLLDKTSGIHLALDYLRDIRDSHRSRTHRMTNVHPSEALMHLLNVLDEKIEGLPDHPWIPLTRSH